ncbi:MAG: response regulator [Rhodocyclaceae bacterium]|jgi:DNA-binding NtrC family response regulator|nr:response regulator [Rhodocyclaceae bacterium]
MTQPLHESSMCESSLNQAGHDLPEARPILVVDDEAAILNALRRELTVASFAAPPLVLETFTDPQAALDRAATQEFAAVLSDYRMPGMNGLEFLAAFHRLQPDCPRIVLSGQTDFAALVRLINETHIYRFLPKPWSRYFLRTTLTQTIGLSRASREHRRLAERVRQQGIELPIGSLNEVEPVLVVDDDLNFAHAVARSLRRGNLFDEVFRETGMVMDGSVPRVAVRIAATPLEGLRLAEEERFSCVITDYRMPVMDGARFLAAFTAKQPDCATIMLSGAVGMEGVTVALDLAHIQAFLTKPLIDHELRCAVAQAIADRRLRLANRVLAQIADATLPDEH